MTQNTDLLKKTGNISQIAGIKHFEFDSGKSKGTAGYEVYNRAGLRFTVLPDKCLDIFDLNYKGVNFSFQTKNGLVANKFFNALGNEFLYYWGGGMLSTCGLANTGPSGTDNGFYQTEHGRIGMTPAENICARSFWQDSDYEMQISGEMSETSVYGSALKLSRAICMQMDSKEIVIKDTIRNLEPSEEEFMFLYHFNFGYPLLDEGSRVVKPKGKILAQTKEAKENIDTCFSITTPEDNLDEQVFFHENTSDAAGNAYVGIINDKLGLGAYLKYKLQPLPNLVQWKSMRSHDYVLGLEPSNSNIQGRKKERENATLLKIKPYEEIEYEVTLGVLDGKDEINCFVEKMKGM